jgi:hypothetical protein
MLPFGAVGGREATTELGEPLEHRLDDPLVERTVELVGHLCGQPAHRFQCGERAADGLLLGGRDADHGQRDTQAGEDAGDADDEEEGGTHSRHDQTSTLTTFLSHTKPTSIMTQAAPSIPQPIGLTNIGCR